MLQAQHKWATEPARTNGKSLSDALLFLASTDSVATKVQVSSAVRQAAQGHWGHVRASPRSVFQHSRRHYVGFVRDLVKADSVRFVEAAGEHVGLLFVAKKAGAQRFIMMRATNRYFVRPPAGPLPTGEELSPVEFQGAPDVNTTLNPLA